MKRFRFIESYYSVGGYTIITIPETRERTLEDYLNKTFKYDKDHPLY